MHEPSRRKWWSVCGAAMALTRSHDSPPFPSSRNSLPKLGQRFMMTASEEHDTLDQHRQRTREESRRCAEAQDRSPRRRRPLAPATFNFTNPSSPLGFTPTFSASSVPYSNFPNPFRLGRTNHLHNDENTAPSSAISGPGQVHIHPSQAQITNRRSLGQRRRQERERAQREQSLRAVTSLDCDDRETEVNTAHVNRSLAQRRRRQREYAMREREAAEIERDNLPATTATVSGVRVNSNILSDRGAVDASNRRTLAQRERRRREREEHQQTLIQNPEDAANLYPTPPATQNQRSDHTNGGHGRRERQVLGNPLFLAARRPYQEPDSRHDLGRMDVECPHCGALHWMKEKLSNSSPRSPEFGMCCKSGKVHLPALRPPPDALRHLFEDQNEQGKDFRDNIWKYNRAFAFTSMEATEDHSVNQGNGPPVFRIQGELFHRSGPLEAAPGRRPTYAQLYIHDPQAALEHRRQQNAGLDPMTLNTLHHVILNNHQYAPVYQYAYEILRGYDPQNDVSIRLRVAPGLDRRRYNLPTADEVAVVLPTALNTEKNARDIVLHRRGGGLQYISDLHPAYVPLYYVVLFPYGENGWHPNLQVVHRDGLRRTRMTQLQFLAYRLQSRRNEYSTILRGGRLLQRFLVDMYAIIDQNRLRFFLYNQPMMRASLYSGLEDAVAYGDDEVDLSTLGQRYILPSSYIGGPRHMQQQYQDAMAIARYFRRVDIFLTVTCNPHWVEITRELLPDQTAYDRPDLVARVFQMKKKAIIEDVYKNGIFGHAVAYVYTTEFQKRGLPHIHMLIILKDPYKLTSPEAINSCIWAYWPDPVTQPLLFDTVKRLMVHGPCGAANPRATCMEDGKCKRNFPKNFSPFTTMDGNGFPQYYRPDDGRAYLVGSNGLGGRRPIMVDNRWLVPYPPYIVAHYDCHANAECAVTLGSLKYLFKYTHKGGDLAMLEEVDQRNEIKRYLDGRYISASEAAHRIFEFEMHERIPSVVRLQVHLPGQHMVVFDPNEDPEVILARASNERTTLTAYFEANRDEGPLGDLARQYSYAEFPQHFRWLVESKEWAIRKQGFAIGRMYYVPPTAGERFYLRLLLTVVKGAKSFEDLRRYDRGEPYPTFFEACRARGLLEDDGEWELCLHEACDIQSGSQLRHLLATILIFCQPSRPENLWLQFRHLICDDLQYRLQVLGLQNATDEDAYDYGLYLLDQILKDSGRSLADWPSMPRPQRAWNEQALNPLIAEQLNYNREDERNYYEQHLPLLNVEQRDAYTQVTHSIERGEGRLFFVSGPGGTGKTFLYRVICSKMRSEGAVVLCVASSGIASLLLPMGRTAHSTFKIPITLSNTSICAISKNSPRADLLRTAKCVIWDEVGAQNRRAMETLDRTLRDIRDDNRPFGGLTMLFGGDFQQTLPVVERGSREEIIDATLLRSYLWQYIQVLYLRQNMRLQGDPEAGEFSRWLLDIGHGSTLNENGQVSIPRDMLANDVESLISFIYPGIDLPEVPSAEYFLNRLILAPRNDDVADLNNDILSRMTGEEHIYYSADEVIHENGADGNDDMPVPPEFLHSINSSSLPPGELRIKVGCPLILLRNLCPSRGLCNGTRMVVRRAGERVLEAQIIGGDHDGEIAFIPRISLTPALMDFAFKIRRRQFPVRLAFALSINKAQGQSVKYVGLDLRIPVFGHGQLYVALSRATSRSRVKVLLADIADPNTMNVVYTEVLLD